MIQKVANPMTRGGVTSMAPTRQTNASDGPESWGRWIGRKYVPQTIF